MATVESLIVELDAKVDRYNDAVRDAMQKTGSSTGKIKADFGSTEKAIEDFNRKSASALKAFAATVVASLSIRALKNYADEWTSVQNRIRTVTNGTAELTQVTTDLLASANNTRSSLESTATLYQRLTQATSDMGFTQERVLALTESLNKSFAVGGANAHEQAGAIRQLAQALASGALRGDEFNSVSEQAPAIMDALVAATGKTKGELREIAAQGKITAEVLVQAVEAYAPVVDDLFAKSVQTIDQTNTKMANSFTMLVGKIDEAAGVSAGYAATGDDIAKAMQGMDTAVIGVIDSIGDWGVTWQVALSDAATSTEDLADTFERELLALNSVAKVTVDLITDAFQDLPSNLKTIMELTVTEYASGLDRMIARGKSILAGARDVWSGAFLTGEGLLPEAQAELELLEEARLAAVNAILNRQKANQEESRSAIKLLQEEREARRAAAQEGDDGQDKKGSTRDPFINLDGETQAPDSQKFLDMLAKRQSAFEESQMSEVEILRSRYEQEQELIQQHYNFLLEAEAGLRDSENQLDQERRDGILQSLEDFNQARLDSEQRYLEGKAKLEKDAEKEGAKVARRDAEQVADAEEMKTQFRLRSAKSAINILSDLGSNSKTVQTAMFLANQGISLSEAFVNTQVGKTKALATLGPAAGPAVAAIEASGALAMASIAAATVGGVGAMSGGGGGFSSASNSPTINTRTDDAPEIVSGQFTISEGGTTNDRSVVMFQANAGDDLGERLADWLNGQMKAGRIG